MAFINTFLWFKSINGKALAMVLVFALAFLRNCKTWSWKRRLQSIMAPRSFCEYVFLILKLLTDILVFISRLERKWRLNLCYCIIKKPFKYITGCKFKCFQNLTWKFPVCLWSIVISIPCNININYKKQMIKILNNAGPKIDTCRVPYVISFLRLQLIFIFTLCCLFAKYKFVNFSDGI